MLNLTKISKQMQGFSQHLTSEVAASHQRLELAQYVAKSGIWDWDVVNGHIEWSSQMFNLFGLDRQKSMASFETWRSALHPEDLEIAGQRIDKALRK